MREEMVTLRVTRRARGSRRWIGLMTLALTAGALIPAALALACNPQAYLTLDKSQYAPGDSVRVTGSFFKGDTNITVSLDRSGQSATVRTAANGSFQSTFALPGGAPAGGYTVSAIGYEATGDVINGLPARASFSVATAQPSSPSASAPSGATPSASGSESAPQTAQPQSGQPSAPQATRPSQQRPAPARSTSAFREPRVTSEPNVQPNSAARGATTRRAQGGATQPTSGGSTAGADRASVGGRAVFGGSVAPVVGATAAPTVAATATPAGATRATGGTRAASRSGATGRQAAEQTATDDVWGSVGNGRSPSVLPVAGDGVAVSSPRSGSSLTLGVLLLGGGALALLGGLAASEARRRRVRIR